MPDSRDTGEHFLGPIPDQSERRSQMSARRVADLTTQIEFLDGEIIRYRELVEHERIRHATESAKRQLEHDTQLDEVRRVERLQATDLHDSYRALMNERKIKFEQSLSAAAGASTRHLVEERHRHQAALEQERNQHRTIVEATRKQIVDESSESHQSEHQALLVELAQASATITRLQQEIDSQGARADHADARTAQAATHLATFELNIDRADARNKLLVAEAELRTAAAIDRLDSERKRSAATLAELLGRSASLAAEADNARSEFVARQAEAAAAAAAALEQATAEYNALAEAADARASLALDRESELEAAIADLRDQLPPGRY